MQTIKKIAQKYNTTMQDLRNFKRDKRDRKQKDLQDDTNFLQVEKENFSAQVQNILEKTKMNKLKSIVKGKEYENKSLLILSSFFSTLGILINNNWVSCENGIHKTFNWLSITSLLCLIVAYIFYKIMDKAYKHFFNSPFLLKNFDKDDRKEKLIDFISIGLVLALIVFSMITNTVAFKSLGANTITSVFLGYGIDIINIICVWFKNKFTSLNGYNSDSPDAESLDKNNDKNLEKNNEKNTNLKDIQNCDNKGIDTNLGLNFFSKKNDENLDKKIDKNNDKKLDKNNDKNYGKAGRKMDKKTRERIIKEIEKLEKDKPVTRKNVNYKGDDKMLKRLCYELLEQDKLIYSKTDKNNRVRFYRK
jgi:hypothetical protein